MEVRAKWQKMPKPAAEKSAAESVRVVRRLSFVLFLTPNVFLLYYLGVRCSF